MSPGAEDPSYATAGCTIRKMLVSPHQYTGHQICCRLIDGYSLVVPEAVVDLHCQFCTGKTEAMVMNDPLCDGIVGNIPSVHNGSSAEVATQMGAAAVIRCMAGV